MSALAKLVVLGAVIVLAGCATQEAVEPVAEEAPEAGPAAEPAPTAVAEAAPRALDAPGIASFVTGTGAALGDGASVTLATGGSPAGRLLPSSSNPEVTLYVTRDGSRPSAENNWGGAIDPSAPRPVTRQTEGSGAYRIVAELDGEYSDVATVYVTWRHEDSPSLDAPAFQVAGRPVSGSVTIPVSDGTNETGRLYITSNYAGATLYINRDGTDPAPDAFWKSQTADGTYLYAPEPTAAEYRVIAVWLDTVSPVASLDVTWE